MKDLIFIGGIHGAGKGTICREICEQTNLVHLTASDILKWNEISQLDNKKVKDIQSTQTRLIEGLRKFKLGNGAYLLDGHFCLFNLEGHVERIPMETFEAIAPKLIAVVVTKIEIIHERLKDRDGKLYDIKTLEYMQTMERVHATQIATILKVPFIEIKHSDPTELISYCNNNLNLTNG